MSDPTPEMGMTVTPEMGLEVLERAKEAIYVAFEGQGDSPASAVSTAIVGYRNAIDKIAALESQIKLNMDYAALCAKHEKTIGDLRVERDNYNAALHMVEDAQEESVKEITKLRVELAKMDCVLFDPGHGWEAERIKTVRGMIHKALAAPEGKKHEPEDIGRNNPRPG